MDIRRLRIAAKSGKLMGVYLFIGDDTELVEEAVAILKQTALGEEGVGLNFRSFSGDEAQVNDLAAEVLVAPFLGDKRLVLLRDVQQMTQSAIKKLASVCESLPSTSCLVATAPSAEGIKTLVAAVQSAGAVVNLELPKRRSARRSALAARIAKKAEEAGIKIDQESVSKFLELAGDDIDAVVSEWEKVASYALGKSAITAEEIEEVVGDRTKVSVFALTDAAASGDFRAAAEALYKLLAAGEEWTGLLALIAWRFRITWQAKNYIAKGMGLNAATSRLRLHPWLAKKVLKDAARLSDGQLMGIFSKILETDLKLKTTGADAASTLELMLFDLCSMCRVESEPD